MAPACLHLADRLFRRLWSPFLKHHAWWQGGFRSVVPLGTLGRAWPALPSGPAWESIAGSARVALRPLRRRGNLRRSIVLEGLEWP